MLENLPQYLANSRKAIIQFLTLVVTLGAAVATFQSSIPDEYAGLITAVVGFAGSALHYLTPNAPAPGEGSADSPFDISSLEDDVEQIADDWKPTELVTASHVKDSIPPDLATDGVSSADSAVVNT